MRIKKVHVRNFRKFLQPVTISDLCGGICVIAGDNEEGKSTIVQAIRSAFHLKYSTTATQHIQPYNSSAMPEVCVEFDLHGTTYQVRKVFGRKGSAELRHESGVFSGSEAEEKLHELCNLSGDKKDSSIWNVLWVEQGTTFGELKVGDAGKRTLQSALERELGSIVGGDQGQDLFQNIKELYLKWYTPTGKDSKHSEHKQAEEQLAELNQQFDATSLAFGHLQAMLDELDDARSSINEFERAQTVEQAQKRLAGLIAQKQEVDRRQNDFRQADQAERAAQAQHQAAATAWKQRNQLGQEAGQVGGRIESIERQMSEVSAKHKSASTRLHDFQQKRDELEATYEQALATCESAEQSEQLRQLHAQLSALSDNLQRAVAADEQMKAIRKQGEAIKLDRAGVDRLRQCDRQFLQVEAQLQAVSTKVVLHPSPTKSASISGVDVTNQESLSLTEITTIALEGWGDIVITPGGGELDKVRASYEKLKQSLSESLKALGVDSIEQAEELERKKAGLIVEYQSASRDLQKHAPAGIAASQDELALVKAKYEELRAAAETKDSQHQLSIFSLTDSADRLSAVRSKRDIAKQELHRSRLLAEQCESEFRDADRLLQSLAVQLKAGQEELARLTERLSAERALAADDVLYLANNETELRMQAAMKHRLELEQQLKALNAEQIGADIEAAEQHILALQKRLQQLREAQSRLEGSLQTLGKTGIAEELERLRGKKEQAETQVLRSTRRAAAVRLLHDTLCEAERNSKQQLAEPLMRRLQPYISELFNGSKFAFDDTTFGIVQLERQIAEPLQSLSLGTREQISVLTRLAFAEVLAESGSPAVVILDDALVYSDEARFGRMQEVLKRASEKFQIIIMTCRERDYMNMGVPIIRLADCVGALDAPAALRFEADSLSLRS